MRGLSRRRYLQGLAAGSAVVLAGCSDSGTGAGGEANDGVETTESDGFLQSSADETGEQSTSQVVSRVQVDSAAGTDIESDRVQTVELVVGRTPGSEPIDLHDLAIQWVGPSGVTDLTAGDRAGESTFAVAAVKDDDGSVPVLNSSEDRAKLTIDVAAAMGSGLETGSEAQLTLATAAGGETVERLTVPDSLAGQDTVTL